MKHYKLHEIAKFLSGLILADFLTWWWMLSYHFLPLTFLGIKFTESMVVPGMIFDAALFIILIHYGWHIGKTPTISKPAFFKTVGTILGIVAIVHLLRVFFGITLVLGSWIVPVWLSWFGVIAAGYLSYMSFKLGMRE